MSRSNFNQIMENSFWLGVYPGQTGEKLAFMAAKLHEAVS